MANFGGGYLNILDNDDLSFTNGVNDLPFSVSFWANFDGLNPGTGAWIWNKRGGGTDEEYQIYFYLNEFSVSLFSGGGNSSFIRAASSYAPPIGSWHHYAVTYDGSETFAGIKMYVDGVSQTLTDGSAGTYIGMINGTRDVYVGTRAWGPGQGNFDGKLDEMHVWRDRELTSAEVLDIYNTENAGNSIFSSPFTPDLVASYNFDADFTDYTGVNNGTAVGTPLAGQTGGVVDNCLLNNTSSYVNMGNNPILQANQITISAWFKTTNAGSSARAIVVKQYAYGVFLLNNALDVYNWSTSSWISIGLSIADGNWHHVCITVDSGVTNGTNVYVDGSLISTFTYTVSNQNEPLLVGNGGLTPAQQFAGNMDEVHVWANRLLDATEVAEVYYTELAGNSIL